MVKKSKLRKAKKPSSNLKKMKEASGVRQSVNVVVNLAERRRQQPRASKKGAVMKKPQGEPLMPSSVIARTPARTPVEINTTNQITQDRLKAIQDEARGEYMQRLLESEKKVLAIQEEQRNQQELLEDQAELIAKGKKAYERLKKKEKEEALLQPPIPSPNIRRMRGPDKSPRKRRGKGNIATPQTEYETQKIETPQSEEPVRFMEREEEEMSQDGM